MTHTEDKVKHNTIDIIKIIKKVRNSTDNVMMITEKLDMNKYF